MDEIKLLKRTCREKVLTLRDALSPSQRTELSKQITQKVLRNELYYRADTVVAYMNFSSEFQTGELIADMIKRGKKLVLPRVDQNWRRLELHLVKDLNKDLQPGVFGIREPRADCPKFLLKDADLLLVPGVAFDRNCGRLGYGVGYYDKLFASSDKLPPSLAPVFSLQIIDEVPLETHDQLVDFIVTENTEYKRTAPDPLDYKI